jgi:hypothetical protein
MQDGSDAGTDLTGAAEDFDIDYYKVQGLYQPLVRRILLRGHSIVADLSGPRQPCYFSSHIERPILRIIILRVIDNETRLTFNFYSCVAGFTAHKQVFWLGLQRSLPRSCMQHSLSRKLRRWRCVIGRGERAASSLQRCLRKGSEIYGRLSKSRSVQSATAA